MSNSQWRAAGIKLLFSSFFQNRIQSFCMPSFKSIWPALQVFSQTNPKNTPNIWPFRQRKTFATKFGWFCIIQKRFEHNWIKNGRAVRFYFWTLFSNLNFLNFNACAIVQCLDGGEGAVNLCPNFWSFSLSKYILVLKMFCNKSLSYASPKTMNYRLSAV